VPTDTPEPLFIPTFETQTEGTQAGVTPIGVTPTAITAPSIAPTIITPTSIAAQTGATSTGVVPVVVTPTEVRGSVSGRSPILSSTNIPLPNQTVPAPTAGIPVTGVQDPAGFARWYFERVWKERDYQNLWDNYLTPSFNAHVGSGLFADYVSWWDSVERVDVNSVNVLENNGTNALVRVNLTLHMKDGHVLQNQIFTYEFLYNANRNTWMFDYTP
jgi:hypothetical protein